MNNTDYVNTFDDILTANSEMKREIEKAKLLSASETPVLIYGETGTGKEMFAQAIISACGVPREKVIIQNCAAIPENLMDAVLFGTTKGIFTGAELKKGLFELADGGVIFLDEMNSISPAVQAKLLRVIQNGAFRPLGSAEDIRVNVKIIGAVNMDPIEAIGRKLMREDLFYRFTSGYISIPPLRERKEDIELFTAHYLELFSKQYNRPMKALAPRIKEVFLNYPWNGNVRELRNIVESLVATTGDRAELDVDCLPPYFESYPEKKSGNNLEKLFSEADMLPLPDFEKDESIDFSQAMEAMERFLIEKTLERCEGNRSRAAEMLNLPRQTLNYKIKRLRIRT